MKVELEKLVLGHSPITDTVFIGIPNKAGNMWLKKHDVTQSFLASVMSRWKNQSEIIDDGENEWEISIKQKNKQ